MIRSAFGVRLECRLALIELGDVSLQIFEVPDLSVQFMLAASQLLQDVVQLALLLRQQFIDVSCVA